MSHIAILFKKYFISIAFDYQAFEMIIYLLFNHLIAELMYFLVLMTAYNKRRQHQFTELCNRKV